MDQLIDSYYKKIETELGSEFSQALKELVDDKKLMQNHFMAMIDDLEDD